MTTRHKPTPGTVSHGTMRPEDLIPAFLSVAESHRLSRANRARVREIQKRHAALNKHAQEGDPEADEDAWETYYASGDANEDTHALFDILDTIAPAGHYFGAHPGDGCDYGFWKHEMEG